MCNQLPGRVHLGALHVRYRSESGLCDPSKTPWYEQFEDYKALTCRFGGAVLVRTQERVVALVVGRFRSVKKSVSADITQNILARYTRRTFQLMKITRGRP